MDRTNKIPPHVRMTRQTVQRGLPRVTAEDHRKHICRSTAERAVGCVAGMAAVWIRMRIVDHGLLEDIVHTKVL